MRASLLSCALWQAPIGDTPSLYCQYHFHINRRDRTCAQPSASHNTDGLGSHATSIRTKRVGPRTEGSKRTLAEFECQNRANVTKQRRDRQTDGQTPGRCFTLSATDAANVIKSPLSMHRSMTFSHTHTLADRSNPVNTIRDAILTCARKLT